MTPPARSASAPYRINEARLMAGASARFEHKHRRLLEEIAVEPLRVAVAGPAFEADVRRAGPGPERGMRIVGELHGDRGAGGVDECERAAPAVEETNGVVGEKGIA